VSANDIEVTAQEAQRRFEAGEVQVVDVREPQEWDAGRIPGDVRHIPLADLTAQAATIDRDKPVVFQCRAGSRSLMAWDEAGLPLDPPDGTVAEH
jgi:rhodanese-related sulfurtransferase